MAININKALEEARRHVHRGEVEQALEVLTRLGEKHPAGPESLLEVGRVYQRSKLVKDAAIVYGAAGRCLIKGGRASEGQAVFRDLVLPLASQDPVLLEEVAKGFGLGGNLEEANRYYQHAAARYLEQGEYDKACGALKAVCDSGMGGQVVRIQLGEALLKVAAARGEMQGEPVRQQALEQLRAVFCGLEEKVAGGGSGDEGGQLLKDYWRLGERIVFLEPRDREFREKLVRAYMDGGKYGEALAHLERWIKHEGDRGDAIVAIELASQVFGRMGDDEKAVRVLQQAEGIYRSRGLIEEADRLLAGSLRVGTSAEPQHGESSGPEEPRLFRVEGEPGGQGAVPPALPLAAAVAGVEVDLAVEPVVEEAGSVTGPGPGVAVAGAGECMEQDEGADLVDHRPLEPMEEVVEETDFFKELGKLEAAEKPLGHGAAGFGREPVPMPVVAAPAVGVGGLSSLSKPAPEVRWAEVLADAEVRLELGRAYWEMGLEQDAYEEAVVGAFCPLVDHEDWLPCRLEGVRLLCSMGAYGRAKEALADTLARGQDFLTPDQIDRLRDELVTVGLVADAMGGGEGFEEVPVDLVKIF